MLYLTLTLCNVRMMKALRRMQLTILCPHRDPYPMIGRSMTRKPNRRASVLSILAKHRFLQISSVKWPCMNHLETGEICSIKSTLLCSPSLPHLWRKVLIRVEFGSYSVKFRQISWEPNSIIWTCQNIDLTQQNNFILLSQQNISGILSYLWELSYRQSVFFLPRVCSWRSCARPWMMSPLTVSVS